MNYSDDLDKYFDNNDDENLDISSIIKRYEEFKINNKEPYFESSEYEAILAHFLDIQNFKKAKEIAEIAVKQYPYSSEINILYCESLIYSGNLPKARQATQNIEKILGESPDVIVLKGILDSYNGKRDLALRKYLSVYNIYDDPIHLNNLIAEEFLRLGDLENAQEYLSRAFILSPGETEIMQILIRCFYLDGRYSQAIEYLFEMIEKKPFNKYLWFALGGTYQMTELYDKSIEAYDYALAIDEDFITAYYDKALSLEKMDNYKLAIEEYHNAIEILSKKDSEDYFPFFKIGECYFFLKDYDKSSEFFFRAVALDPQQAKVWYSLSALYLQYQQYDTAFMYIEKAIYLDEEDIEFYRLLWEIEEKRSNLSRVEELFAIILNHKDKTEDDYLDYAYFLYQQGDVKKALETVNLSLKIYGDLGELLYYKAMYQIILKQRVFGIRTLQKALSISPALSHIVEDNFPELYSMTEVFEKIQLATKDIKG